MLSCFIECTETHPHRNECVLRSDAMHDPYWAEDVYEREYINRHDAWGFQLNPESSIRRARIDPYEEELNNYDELYIDLYDFFLVRHNCGHVYFERERERHMEEFFLAGVPEGLRYHIFNRLRLSLTRAMGRDFGHPNNQYLFKYWYDETGRETGGFVDAHEFFSEYGRLFLGYIEDGIGAQERQERKKDCYDCLWSMDWYRFVLECESGLDNPYMYEDYLLMPFIWMWPFYEAYRRSGLDHHAYLSLSDRPEFKIFPYYP